MRQKKSVLLLFLCAWIFNYSSAQNYNLFYKKINNNNEIFNKIDQDKEGFLWLKTNKKISKYNGKNFEDFSYLDLSYENLQQNDFVPDVNNNIWIYDYGGNNLKILNPNKKELKNFSEMFPQADFDSEDVVPFIYRDSNYNIYFTVKNKGLIKYDGKKFIIFFDLVENTKFPILHYTLDNFSYYACENTIYRLNNKSLSLEKFHSDYLIYSIEEFDGKPIFGSHQDNTFMFYQSIVSNKLINFFPEHTVETFYNKKTNYYQKYQQNLYLLNYGNSIKLINNNKEVEYEILISDILDPKRYTNFFVDRHDNIWITSFDGLYKLELKTNKVKNSIEGYSLRSIFKKDSEIYVCTYKGGVVKMTKKNDAFLSTINVDVKNAKASLYYNDTLWVANEVRLYNYNFNTNKSTLFDDDVSESYRGYNCIAKHPKSNTFFLGSDYNLYTINTSQKKIQVVDTPKEVFPPNTAVFCLINYNNSLLVGTSKGLFCLNDEQTLVRLESKNYDFTQLNIRDIYLDDDNTLWLATKYKGIISWNRKNDEIKIFNEKAGLSNNTVHAIYKDDYGFFWLPTDFGLNRFAPKTLNNEIFFESDGLTHNEFNYLSHYQDDEGLLYFGGLNGLNIIDPKDFIENETKNKQEYKIYIEDVKFLEDDLKLIEQRLTVLHKDAVEYSKLKGFEKLQINVLDYLNGKTKQVFYKIEPLHQDYQFAESNSILLTDLKAGEYKLFIKAQSINGRWTMIDPPISLIIESSFFNLIIVVIASLFIFMPVIYITKKRTATFLKKANPIIIEVQENTQTLNSPIQKENKDEEQSKLENAKYDRWLEDFDSVILQNITSVNFSIEFLSQELDLSERQLQRRIKKITGKTPNKYITEIKLKEAYRMIKDNEVQSVKELSKKVGYSTPDYFSKLFKNRFEKNPSDLLNF